MGDRRRPVQDRSRAMVDRLLAATARVLAERGYAGLSTNRVAAAAGVSVGSLYRYFDDKDDLVRELRVRSTTDILGDLTAAMSAAVALPTRDAIRQVLATLVAALQRHRPLTSALVNEVPLGAQSYWTKPVLGNMGEPHSVIRASPLLEKLIDPCPKQGSPTPRSKLHSSFFVIRT